MDVYDISFSSSIPPLPITDSGVIVRDHGTSISTGNWTQDIGTVDPDTQYALCFVQFTVGGSAFGYSLVPTSTSVGTTSGSDTIRAAYTVGTTDAGVCKIYERLNSSDGMVPDGTNYTLQESLYVRISYFIANIDTGELL